MSSLESDVLQGVHAAPEWTAQIQAEIIRIQAEAIGLLIRATKEHEGAPTPSEIIRAVTSNDLSLLIKKDDDKGEPTSDVLIP